jgi:hypothetical protein
VSTSSRIENALLGGGAALAGLSGFVASFWLMLGQGAASTTREWLAAVCGTLWLLAVVYAAHRLARRREDARAARRAAAQALLEAARERERDLVVAELAHDPRLEPLWPLIRRWRLTDRAALEATLQRYHALLADPRRAHHAAGVLQGLRWSDAQLAYFDDPAARITCAHLQPVENALRAAGRRCWPQGPAEVGTEAALRFAALREQLALAPCVRESYEDDHPHAPPREYLRCTLCRSAIESGSGAPFPAE